MVNQSKELPPMSDFRLKNMLENGTNLERVNTKMLAPKELDLNAFENPDKQEPQQEPQQESQQQPQQQSQQGE